MRRFRGQVGVRAVVREPHGADEEGLEEHQDRLGVAAVRAALLADRDEVREDQRQQARVGPREQRLQPQAPPRRRRPSQERRGCAGQGGRAHDRDRAEEETEDFAPHRRRPVAASER